MSCVPKDTFYLQIRSTRVLSRSFTDCLSCIVVEEIKIFFNLNLISTVYYDKL